MHCSKLYSLGMEVNFWISFQVLDFEISGDTFKLSKSKYSKTYGFLHYISSIKCMIFLIVVYMYMYDLYDVLRKWTSCNTE